MKKLYLIAVTLLLSFTIVLAQEKQEKIGNSPQPKKVNKQAVADQTNGAIKLNSTTAVATYDFTVAGAAYVNPAVPGNPPMKDLGGGVYGMIAGDVNGDGEVKYNGSASDRVAVLVEVGFATPNNIISSAYSKSDVNMDGEVKYNGSASDRVKILTGVGFATPNTILKTHVPSP